MVSARSKGASGEREAALWLQEKFHLEETPKRNLEQVRSGGFDLTGFDPFAVEVKRCQTLAKRDWWIKLKKETPPFMEPVVMYRKNRQPWRFLISASNIGLSSGYIQLEAAEFVNWAKKVLDGC